MGSRRSRGGGLSCLICCNSVDANRKPLKIPEEFGRKQVDVFLKICELLGVSFLEIQQDWSFPEGKDTLDGMPLCLLCVNGFHSVLKLQNQLSEIKRKIDDKVASMREKIRAASTPGGMGYQLHPEPKITNFRIKALGHNHHASATTTLAAATFPSVMPAYSVPPAPQSQHISFNAAVPTQTSSWYVPQQPPAPAQVSSLSAYHSGHVLQTTLAVSSDFKPHSSTASEDHNISTEDYYSDGGGDAGDNAYSSDSEPDAPAPPPPKRKPGPKSRSSAPFLRMEPEPEEPNPLLLYFPAVPRPFTETQSSSTVDYKRDRQTEYFAPIITDSEGRMTFEGIVLTPVNGGYQCGECGSRVGKDHSSISLRKAKIHVKGFHLGAYRCHLCDKPFTSNDILNQHLFRTHEKGEIPCPTCGKPIQERNIKLHQVSHMNAEERAAAKAAGLIKEPKVYTPNLPCRICGKLFDKPSKLKRHELVHVDSKFRRDFKCTQCPKAFTTAQAVREHFLCEHDPDNAPKQLCTECGETIPWRLFKKHQNLHKELCCPTCLKRFLDERSYKKHLLKCGTNYKPKEGYEAQCDICLKYFSSQIIVNKHRRKTHANHWKLKVPTRLMKDVSVEDPNAENLDDLNNEGIQHVEGNRWSYQLYDLDKMGDGGWLCCTCKQEFKNDGEEDQDELDTRIMDHVRQAHVGNFRCNWCSKKMKSLDEVLHHTRLEHESGPKKPRWDCDVCGQRNINLDRTKSHEWSHFSLEEMVAEINALRGYPNSKQYEEPPYKRILEEFGVNVNIRCEICPEEDRVEGLGSVLELWQHRMDKHGNIKVKIVPRRRGTGKRPGRQCVYDLPPIEDGPPYRCLQCDKVCSTRIKLRKHFYHHHGNSRIARKRRKAQKQQTSNRKRKKETDSEEEEEEEEEEEQEEEEDEMEQMVEKAIKEEVMSEDDLQVEEGKCRCDTCGKSVAKNKIKKHEWGHHLSWEDMVDALGEGDGVPSEFNVAHVDKKRRDKGLSIETQCGLCGEAGIEGVAGLWQHRKTQHADIKLKRVNRGGRKDRFPYPRAKGPFPCPYCHKTKATPSAYRKHIYNMHAEEYRQQRRQDLGLDVGGRKKRGKQGRNVKVICEEDEQNNTKGNEEMMEQWEGVEVKEEVFSMSEGEDEGDWMMEEQVESRWRSLRDRSAKKYREEDYDSSFSEEEEESDSENEMSEC